LVVTEGRQDPQCSVGRCDRRSVHIHTARCQWTEHRSPKGADDTPIPSGEVLRSAKFPEAQGGRKPSDGLLPIVFHCGDKSGHIG